MVRVSRDPWIDSTHTGIGSLVLNLEINILVVSYPHSSLQYCTVYTYSCILPSLQPIVLYSVHVFMYPTFTPAYSTVQCTRIHVSYPHFSVQYCTVYMYSCILLSLQPIILYKTKIFMYPTLTPTYSTVQCTCIHVSYSYSSL